MTLIQFEATYDAEWLELEALIEAIRKGPRAGASLAATAHDDSHERARLAALHDRTMAGPVSAVLSPEGRATGFSIDDAAVPSGPDVISAAAWIGGNTWEHYDAHHGWIRELVARGSSRAVKA